MSISPETLYILYDGDCPFCARYVRLLRLKDAVGTVEPVNAREAKAAQHEALAKVLAAGYRLDEGMAMLYRGDIAHGQDCIHRMALLSTRSGPFNRLNAWLFRSRRRAALAYPVLRAMRNLTLRLLGVAKLGF